MSFLTKVLFSVNIRSRSLAWYSSPKTDPGINLRKKILNSNDELEETDFDDLESDFINVHKTHKEHVTEIDARLEREKFLIVKQKYFKEKHLNFLTWHDKEQIRYLHNNDPEEWTIEKLSEGFPALPEDIKKILKSKWTIKPTRLTNHDRSVQKNWENFKNGQIPNLPRDLVDHLNKFTNRTLNFKSFEAPNKNIIKVNTNMKQVGTEFSEIITSYEELKAKKSKSNGSNEELTIDTDTFNDLSNNKYGQKVSGRKTGNKPVTLHQLQNTLEKRLNKGKELSEDEKLLVSNFQQTRQEAHAVEINENNVEDIMKNKYETNKGASLMKKNQPDLNYLTYPQKITIPQNLKKEGYTYKLNDCYYDDDGLFLYRVPGMY